MTTEDKELLLKDLCSRLPYGVKVLYEEEIYQISIVDIFNETITICGRGYPMEVEIQKVKPYLLPISSMPKEQKKYIRDNHPFGATHEVFDWLDKNNYDYRGLIDKGLVDDATELNIY